MISAHQAHDSRVMISLHETYNKKTDVILATMDAMYKKGKDRTFAAPLQCSGCCMLHGLLVS